MRPPTGGSIEDSGGRQVNGASGGRREGTTTISGAKSLVAASIIISVVNEGGSEGLTEFGIIPL